MSVEVEIERVLGSRVGWLLLRSRGRGEEVKIPRVRLGFGSRWSWYRGYRRSS